MTTVFNISVFLYQLQFVPKEDATLKSNFAVVEFKTSEAAEKCIKENDGTKVGDQILNLSFAIPGYSGVDFVWNKAVNINFKRAQVCFVS